ncbi:MAG: hypothetical protein NZ602_05520 [Thermoguttaceae bacterium]|nr:hypothetical protein [Thermoguttaceae bacterium]MDW8038841.1 hypothetical protein [Thermoguttaceae bacterium]
MRAQEIVEAARMAVFTPLEGPTDTLRQLAAEYKGLCERINERLARCGELMRKGNRSEAIRLAEMEPNLLDLVALADFPERDSFIELCQYFGLETSPPLLLDIAAELNEAYAREQPLEALLRRYRLYALARAPLKKRLSVLRQLAKIDGQNLYWKKDQEIFENERIQEIRRELAEAVQKCDIGLLEALAEELRQTQWINPPPEALIQAVDQQRHEVAKQIMRQQLVELAQQLHEAWEKLDVRQARQVRTAWQQIAELAQLPANDPLQQQAAPALNWLAEEDQKEAEQIACQQAMASLERCLDRNEKNLPKLQKLYRQATLGGRELPPYLERMYQLRIEELQRAAKSRSWRNYILTLMVGLALSLLVGAGLVSYRSYQQYRQTATSLQNLLRLVEKSSPSESLSALLQAKSLIDQLQKEQPVYCQWTPLPELTAKIMSLWEKNTFRQQQLQQLLSQISKLLDQPPEQLGRNDFDFCQAKFQEAEPLAHDEQEKLRLQQLRNRWNEIKFRWQRLKDQQAREQMKPLADQLAQLENSPNPPPQALKQIQQLLSQLSQLAKTHPDISDPVRTELAVLREKAQSLQRHFQLRDQEDQSLAKLAELVGDHDRFLEILKQHLRQFPNSPRSFAYKQVVDEHPYWKTLDRWNRYAQQWNSSSSQRFRLMEDQNWLEGFQSWVDFPGMEAVGKIRPYLTAVRNQANAGLKELQEMLENPPFQDTWIVPYGEKFYYVLQPPEIRTGAVISVEYIVDYDRNVRRVSLKFTEKDLAPTLAPHIPLCKELVALLRQTTVANWEKNFCHMIQKVLITQTQPIPIDPTLRLCLLEKLLNIASQGSYPIQQGFQDWQNRIRTGPVDIGANWLNPELIEWKEQRRLADEFLKRFSLNELAANQQKAAELWQQFHSFRLPEFQWIGFLQSEGDRWRCVLKAPSEVAKQDGILYVLTPVPAGGCRTICIGSLRQGNCQLRESADREAWLEGRPVFSMSK